MMEVPVLQMALIRGTHNIDVPITNPLSSSQSLSKLGHGTLRNNTNIGKGRGLVRSLWVGLECDAE